MTLRQGLFTSTAGRLACSLLSAGVAALLILLAAACEGDAGSQPGGGSEAPATESGAATTPDAAPDGQGALTQAITMYSSPTCGCCHEYEKYLAAEGFEVESIRTEDFVEIKESRGIPPDMRSCHTGIVGEYFVEGHVPVEAIRKLLDEQPAIEGIALPGMPAGSPGMGGEKTEPFVIYSIVDGRVDEFMTL